MLRKTKVYIDVFYYKTALSGLKTYIEELVSAIQIYGNEDVEYIFSHDLDKIVNKQLYVNSKYRIIRWIFQFQYFFWKQIVLPIDLIIKRADIVICPDYIAPFLCPSKKIVVIHDNLFWKYPENYSSIWRKYFTKLINWGLSSNSIIVTTSNYSKKGLKSIFRENKIYSVYQSSDNIMQGKLTNNDKKYILHIGTFEKRKNLLTLIKAFKKLKEELKSDYKLVLAGSKYINGDEYVLKEIQNYILKNNLNSSVFLPGYINKNKALYFYSNSLLYVFPSLDEGFGIPLIEALNMKVPVICSNIPIFKEIAGDSVLYFEKENETDLFKKMKFIIHNKNLYNQLIEKGSNRVKQFNRFNFIKEFEKIY